jgi:hypothetical protein
MFQVGEVVNVMTLDGTILRGRVFVAYHGQAGEPVVLRRVHGRALDRVWMIVPASNVSRVELTK